MNIPGSAMPGQADPRGTAYASKHVPHSTNVDINDSAMR